MFKPILILLLDRIFADGQNQTMTFFQHLTLELTPLFNVTYNDTILAKSLQGNPAMLRNINPYGCWCNFDNMPNFLGGDPVDEIDRACKILQESYRCVQIDDENELQKCDIYTTKYIPSTSFYSTFGASPEQVIDNISADCSRENGASGCAYNLCTIEGFFLTEMLSLLTSSGKWNHKHKHTSPFWPEIKDQYCAPEFRDITEDSVLDVEQTGRFDFNAESSFGLFDDFEKDPYEEEINKSIAAIEGEVYEVEEEVTIEIQAGGSNGGAKDASLDIASPRPLTAIKSVAKKKRPNTSVKKDLELLAIKVISKDECCGTYPLRLPFNQGLTEDNQIPLKGCCNNQHIFNTATKECCYGELTSVGSC